MSRFCCVIRKIKYPVQYVRHCSNLAKEPKIEEKTYFGYEEVTPKQKVERVHGVFQNVAKKYDLMNDVMSMGIHRVWKDIFVSELGPTHGIKMLDVAGGTGDIALRVAKLLSNPPPGAKDSKIIICDVNEEMLEAGKEKTKDMGINCVEWVVGDAMDLREFEEGSFDAYTIAFGIRNVLDITKALKEAYRVLRPGGRFLCLEFSKINNTVLSYIYDQYSFQVIPAMGEVVAGDWKSYQYLVESIRTFPKQDEFANLIKESGFRQVNYKNLTFGLVSIHSAFKI